MEFTLETNDRIRNEKERYEGTFKLLRMPKGEILASYTLAKREKSAATAGPPWVGLLNRGTLYVLNPDKKEARRFKPEDGNVRLWLEEKFNPFAILLDKKHARTNCRLFVTMQDETYTFLEVKPKPRKSSRGWLEMRIVMERGRAVFMRKGTGRGSEGYASATVVRGPGR